MVTNIKELRFQCCEAVRNRIHEQTNGYSFHYIYGFLARKGTLDIGEVFYLLK